MKMRIIEVILVTGITTALVIVNLWHVIARAFSLPDGTLFVGITHHYEDYFYYLSQLTQGEMGSWTVRNLFTTDPIPAVPLWWTNILLGKMGGIFGAAPWETYRAGIAVISAILLVFSYYAARRIFPSSRIRALAAFLIASLTSTGYALVRGPEGYLIQPFVYFYNYTASLNRLGGVIHLMLQNILSLGAILLAALMLERLTGRRPKAIAIPTICLAVVMALLSTINPIYAATDAIVIAITFLLYLPRLIRRKTLGLAIVAGIITAIPLGLAYLVVNQSFSDPFYQYFRWWENQVRPTTYDKFFRSFGLIGVLMLLGAVPFLSRLTPLRVMGTLWAILPLIVYLTPIPNRLLLPYFRIHQPPAYVFFGALAAEGLMVPGMIFSRAFGKKIVTPLFILLVSLYCLIQVPPIVVEIRNRNSALSLGSSMNYVPLDVYEGLKFLKQQNDGLGAISINNTEFLIPAVSGHPVYVGHASLSPGYAQRIAEAFRLITGKMTPAEAYRLMKDHGIGYVVWNKHDGVVPIRTPYPFLRVVFENTGIIIFKITP